MFRLIRLVIFVMLAFVAGILFERDNQKKPFAIKLAVLGPAGCDNIGGSNG